MNTFHSTISKGVFFYQAGSVITHKPWKKPTYENVEIFLDEINDLSPYDMYLVGGVANGKIGNTWDIDIVVTGAIVYQEFQEVIHQIYDIALNRHNLLVDIRWIDKPIERLQYLIDNKITETYKSVRFGYYLKKIGDDVSEINLFDEKNRINDYLIEKEIIFPTEKSFNSKSNNYIKI
jgi:hypothetical protein